MSIIIEKNIPLTKIEGKYKLVIKRNREDIAKLLKELENSKRLNDIFPYAVANSIKNILLKDGLIDESESVQELGKQFICNPYKNELEIGIYAIDFAKLEINERVVQFPVYITRKLSNTEPYDTVVPTGIVCSNDFIMDGDEVLNLNEIQTVNNCKYYRGDSSLKNIKFDYQNDMYIIDNKELRLGVGINNILNDYASKVINATGYMQLLPGENCIHINNINDLTTEELLAGSIYNRVLADVTLSNVPIQIDDYALAVKYSYIYIYNLLNNGQYMNIKEMNEVFENEILSKGIFNDKVSSKMQSFSFSLDGFKTNLTDAQFQDLSYKLKVMNELLNYQVVDNSFSNVHNYDDVIRYLNNSCGINTNNVDKLYMVMGYAFARNVQNNLPNCVSTFKKYMDLSIVRKKGKNPQQKEDDDIERFVREDKNIEVLLNDEIGKNFHDRYLVFKMKDSTYKVLLSTCEIGSLFDNYTKETKGTIMPINMSEVVKNNKSLITMIEEAKLC